MSPLTQAKGGISTCTVSYIYSRETFQSGSPFKDQRSWRKCHQSPSTDIQRHCMCILNQRDSFMRGCITPSCPKKKTIKQKYRRLTSQTATNLSYQVLSMLNEKFTIIPWVHFMDYTLICCLLKTGKFFFINLSKYTGFYSWWQWTFTR